MQGWSATELSSWLGKEGVGWREVNVAAGSQGAVVSGALTLWDCEDPDVGPAVASLVGRILPEQRPGLRLEAGLQNNLWDKVCGPKVQQSGPVAPSREGLSSQPTSWDGAGVARDCWLSSIPPPPTSPLECFTFCLTVVLRGNSHCCQDSVQAR